jgi:predicted metalloendopeptidase
MAALGSPVLFALAACGTLEASNETVTAPAPTKVQGSGVVLENMDSTVREQDDFYRHVNGGWLARTEIPADKSSYGAFVKLADDAEFNLRAIIEESAASKDRVAGSDEQKVGDFYASFMDEARSEELGLKPLAAQLSRIDGLKSADEIAALMADFFRQNIRNPIAGFIDQDARDPGQYIVYLTQSGLGLPDRDYYLLDEAGFKDLRAAYLSHVEKMLTLAGDANAANDARAIMTLETALAKQQWTRVESRDRDKTYNKYDIAMLKTLMPAFAWDDFLQRTGITSPAVIIRQPSAFAGFGEQLTRTPLPVWKAYFKWRLLSSEAPYLSKIFVDEDFSFYGKTLRGTQENRPRWKRAVAEVENSLGESLGRIYVARHFPPEAKARMDVLVGNLIKAYEQSIQDLDWMSAETRKQALVKLAKFTPKIGYPGKWRDYSGLTVTADDLVGNVLRSAEFEHAFQVAKLGKPIDRQEWFMTPQTVNAYYNPGMNEIVFPAAILQPPFFNLNADDAVNYGGIGAVIGHEIGHGFDDQGSKYDGDGTLRNWWTDVDRKAFEGRTRQLIAQYDAYEPIPGQHVNGALTIGENIGDLGGISIAYKAYKLSLGGQEAPVLDGFTGDQRFFIGWAQVWASKDREEALLLRLKTNPHSPNEYRCNGTLVNLPSFYAAFGVKDGDRMFKPAAEQVKIW